MKLTSTLAIMVIALLIGCTTVSSEVKTHSKNIDSITAAKLAATIANKESKQRYDVTPFSASDSKATLKNNHWYWEANKGFGTGDLLAQVSFAKNGSHPKVKVFIQSNSFEF